MGRLTRTCLKLCQSTSNVVITPRFKRDSIPNKLTALFLCFISRWLEYANEIIALGSRKLVFYFNIGVFHRQILPPTYLRPPLPIFNKKIQKKIQKLKKNSKNFFPTLAFIIDQACLVQSFDQPYLPPPLPAPTPNCHSSKLPFLQTAMPLTAIALNCHRP